MSKRTVRVVIPFYKRQDQLDKCLKAVAVATAFVQDKLHVLVDVIDNSENNRGFPAAVNIGLRRSMFEREEYAVVLNQDCYLAEDAIEKMVAFMDAHGKCAIGSVKQLSDANNDLIIHGGVTECYPRGIHLHGYVSKGDCSVNKRMPWANGACMIFRVSLIPEYGLLDESLFLIGSDSDASLSARARGYEVWYIADAVCVHEQGVTSGGDEWAQRRMYLDMIYFRSKWINTDLFRELMMEVFD